MYKSGIYKILNLVNNKFYIGSALNINSRFNIHKCLLRKNKHHSRHLQSAWNKYGETNFEFKILEYCEKDNLLKREQFWLDETKCYDREFGYNCNPNAESPLGLKHSEYSNLKNSIRRKGRKQSEETKRKRSEALKGRPLSELNKLRISQALKGKTRENPLTIEQRLNVSKAQKDRRLAERRKRVDHLTFNPMMDW